MAERKTSADVKVALSIAGVLAIGGALIGGTGLAIVLTPIVFLILLYAMVRVPLRDSLLTLTFFSLTLENPSDQAGCGIWKSPLYGLGGILLDHINSLDRSVSALSPFAFSGAEACMAALLLIALSRRLSGSKLDTAGRIATPKPLVRLALISLAGTAFVWLTGLVRGGTFRFSLWQVNAVVHLPIIFLLFHMGFRGPKDHAALAKVFIAAAVVRASLAMYIMSAVTLPPDPDTGSTKLPYATTHHDSMLFAGAFVVLIGMLIERVGRKSTRLAYLLLPILVGGMVENHRRMVWVQVAVVMLTVYLVAPDNKWKRTIRRTLMIVAPVVALYLFIGWDEKYGRLWKPVAMIRSVVDSKSDASSFWRQLENYDLITTVQRNPLLGAGYGNPYEEVVTLPSIPYELERYLPHNSILGLWCYCGYIGYTAMTMLWVAGIYFGLRAYHATRDPKLRVAALASFGAVLIYLVQCWGDMGLGTWTGIFMVGPALAVAGKLAVATGAWGKSPASGGRARISSIPGTSGAEQAA